MTKLPCDYANFCGYNFKIYFAVYFCGTINFDVVYGFIFENFRILIRADIIK